MNASFKCSGLQDDEVWSDDEGIACLDAMATKQTIPPPKAIEPDIIVASKGSKVRSKIFCGSAITGNSAMKSSSNSQFDIAMPYVPIHVYEALGEEAVRLLWTELLKHGVDESAMVLMKDIDSIASSMTRKGYNLPFHGMNTPEDGNEYIEFLRIIDILTVKQNNPGALVPIKPSRVELPPCCAASACNIHSRNEKRVCSQGDERPDFRLDVIYRRWILNKKGVVRVNDVPAILDEADIPYDISKMADFYWIVHGDELLLNVDRVLDVAEKIRLDSEDKDNQLDLYRLPKWLQNEFMPQEITMFRHHFMMIDTDQGGSIDATELQSLGESLGNKMTVQEAEILIAEHDEDNSGTIDFSEFMGLMFKILHGTIDVENNKLGKAMMESRSQIKLYEEIEHIKECPPKYVRIKQYGGNPIECEYILDGPVGSLYEGGSFVFKVIYRHGYPYTCPECYMMTRMVGVNMFTQTNGTSVIPHVKYLWDTSWDTRQLLSHVLSLMIEPSPSYLEPHHIAVVKCSLKQHKYDCDHLSSIFACKGDNDTSHQVYVDHLPRLEQLHLNIVVLYLSDRQKYESLVKQFVLKYGTNRFD